MKRRRILFFTISLFGIVIVFLPSILRPLVQGQPAESQKPSPTTPAAPATSDSPQAAPVFTDEGEAIVSPIPPLQFTSQSTGESRDFAIALDEGVERHPDGKDHRVIIDPPATPSTLAMRLSENGTEHPVFPVCYEVGKPLTEEHRRIITPELTLRLAQPSELPELPAGLTLIDQPAYAPGFIIVAAKDSFAAIAALSELRALTDVAKADIQLAAQRQTRTLPNDSLINDQWHLSASGSVSSDSDVNVEGAWLYGSAGGVRGNGIRIGIVDDGLQTSHPDLAANVDTTNDYDWNGDDSSPEPSTGDDHGTACAGNAAAVGNNNLGVAGTAPESTLVGMRLIAAATVDSQEAEALSYLPDLIEIKSNSWGPSDDGGTLEAPGSLTEAALENAAATGRNGLGTIFVWAGGNGGDVGDNSNYDGYANSIYTIAVGATNSLSGQAYYSEPGANLLVCAPSSGEGATLGITTTDRTGTNGYSNSDYTDDFGGTSSSTPTVAGIIALLLEKNPNLGWRDVQEILLTSAYKVDASDPDWITNAAGQPFNHNYGAGLVDATAAVALAEGWSNLAVATAQTVSAPNLSLTIPDNDTKGVEHEFTLNETNLRCEHVTLTASITHAYRGDLAITLISPSGTESRLSEVHGDDGNNYSSWTFSTVRNWGENSQGTWTVRVADGDSGTTGTVTSLALTVHGALGVPTNPAPVVTIDSPTNGSVFSPNASVSVVVSATDSTADGSEGEVTSVELFDNGSSQGTLTSPPYQFTLTPGLGSHSLSAVAIDSEGNSSTSSLLAFTVVDQAPTISAASVNPASQAFSDEDLTLTGLSANDPEGSTLTYSYQWQSSSDGTTWTDSGLTGDTVAADPSRAGFLWRCVVTANDGINDSAPFTTAATNSLTRPPLIIAQGESLNYQSGLVLRGSESTLSRDALINEFSQGQSGSSEWVEILVLQQTSLRNWQLADANGTPLEFTDSAVWDQIPAGALIVIYNSFSKDSLLPNDSFDLSSGALVIASDEAAYFSGGWPGYGNGGDQVLLRDGSGTLVAGFSYGSNLSTTPSLGAVGSGDAVYFTGDDEAAASLAANWEITTSTTARLPRANRIPTTLPLSYGGSWSALPDGFTSSGVSTYGSSLGTDTDPGSAKFDGSGDRLTLEFDQSAASVSYQLKGNTSSPSLPTEGTFVVEESSDGTTFTPLRTITNQDTSDTAYSESPTANTRFIRFRYETKVTGNLQFDQLEITAQGDDGGSDSLTLSIAPTTFTESDGPTAATGTLTLPEALGADLTVTLNSSDTTAATVSSTVTITAGQTTVNFSVSAVDDSDSDGSQFATITASATGYPTAAASLTILDDEPSLEGVTPAAGNNVTNIEFVADLQDGLFNSPALFRLTGSPLPEGLILDEATGLISGTISYSAAVGTHPVTLERYNSFGEAVSLSFSIEVTAGSGGFAAWIAGENVTDSAATADPDGDGLANLLEYYLAGSADTADPEIAPTLASIGNDSFTVTFWHSKSASDVAGIIEWSDTLLANSWSTEGVLIEVLTDETTRELLQATIPNGTTGKRFARLRVE